MDEDLNVKSGKEWTGYKIATFLISISSALIIIGQAIYGNYYLNRWNEIQYLEKKRQELIEKQEVPRLKLTTNTLERAGLSNEMLKSLSAIPSTVEVKHISGTTAKGLRLDISCNVPIINFQQWQSDENFSVKKLDAENKKLRLEALQLRKGSTIGLTILTKELPKLETNALIDTGEVSKSTMDSRIEVIESGESRIYRYPSDSEKNWRDSVSRRVQDSPVASIDERIKELRSQTVIDWLRSSFGVSTVAYILLLGFIAPFLWILTGSFLKDRRQKLSRQHLIDAIKANKFTVVTLPEMIQHLGSPDDIKVGRDKEGDYLQLLYFSKYDVLRNTKGIKFHFREQKLLGAYDESGMMII